MGRKRGKLTLEKVTYVDVTSDGGILVNDGILDDRFSPDSRVMSLQPGVLLSKPLGLVVVSQVRTDDSTTVGEPTIARRPTTEFVTSES